MIDRSGVVAVAVDALASKEKGSAEDSATAANMAKEKDHTKG